jgi:catechol 2,3-dioxygenase-like lactoylglutathione lyase family enzyme
MTIPAIDQQVTFITCADLEASSAFYREVLGLVRVLDQGDCQIFRVAGEAFLGVCRRRAGRALQTGGVVVTFVTQDVDGWYRYLIEQGVATEGAPAEKPDYGIYNFFARDPDGYLIEFQTFLTEKWPAPRQ